VETMDLQALKTELTTDPLNRGYAALNDEAAAALLNKPDRQPNRDTLDSGLFVGSIVAADYTGLTSDQRDRVRLLATPPLLFVSAHIRQELSDMFPPGSATRTNLRAALKRPGSRAEELGLGRVTESDVADARRLP
jgi:hypothetical protein